MELWSLYSPWAIQTFVHCGNTESSMCGLPNRKRRKKFSVCTLSVGIRRTNSIPLGLAGLGSRSSDSFIA